MADANHSGFSGLWILPVWPFSSRERLPAFPSSAQASDHLGQRSPPALQRTKPSRRVADFSIRSILALEGSEGGKQLQEEPPEGARECGGTPQGYTWIHCTRFKTPAVAKMKPAGSSRPPSRSPRVPFSATQLGTLERNFQQTRYLSTGQVRNVALLLGLTENRVKIWFQNRRARERRDFLKQQPDCTIVGMKGGHLQVDAKTRDGAEVSGWAGVKVVSQ